MAEHGGPFATVEEAVEEIRQGKMIVLVDDEDRENEGDLTMAAEKSRRKRSISWRNSGED